MSWQTHTVTTEFGEYRVADVVYAGRKARVLYSGGHAAAQSGVALDDNPELLFDYNERFMELTRGVVPHSVLVIGGGAYTLPSALLAELPDIALDVVEPDAGLAVVAQQYFGYKPSAHTRSFAMGGAEYLQICTIRYDLIIIDAFIHDRVPAELQTRAFALNVQRALNLGGTVAMNVIAAAEGPHSQLLRRLHDNFSQTFGRADIYPAAPELSAVIPENFIICAGAANADAYLSYPSIVLGSSNKSGTMSS